MCLLKGVERRWNARFWLSAHWLLAKIKMGSLHKANNSTSWKSHQTRKHLTSQSTQFLNLHVVQLSIGIKIRMSIRIFFIYGTSLLILSDYWSTWYGTVCCRLKPIISLKKNFNKVIEKVFQSAKTLNRFELCNLYKFYFKLSLNIISICLVTLRGGLIIPRHRHEMEIAILVTRGRP